MSQLDLLRDSPAAVASAYCQAAETALHDPYFTPEQRRSRHDYYLGEAMKLLTPQQRRRLNFIRAERLSLSESRDIPGDFDPGPEYDTP